MIRVLLLVAAGVMGMLLVALCGMGAMLRQSMLPWPVDAPLVVTPSDTTYPAMGWRVTSPFGWRLNPMAPDRYELHEGIDLAGPMFCDGCPVPPLLDLQIAIAGVRWDVGSDADPMHAGAGVVVEATIQHPGESGMLDGSAMHVLYGHLQPYRVHVRTETCVRDVSCPGYTASADGTVTVSCPGDDLVPTMTGGGETSYAYASPGRCQASVVWPDGVVPDGPTEVTFDQRIVPGQAASDAAILFRGQLPAPPPVITDTGVLTPTVP